MLLILQYGYGVLDVFEHADSLSQLLKEFFHAVYIAGYVQVFRTSFRVQKK